MSADEENVQQPVEETDDAPSDDLPRQGEVQLENWSLEEKRKLLHFLKVHGSDKPKEIAQEISSKSLEETETAIKYYKLKSSKLLKSDSASKNSKQENSLLKWINLLKETFHKDLLDNDLSKAIRILAECGNIPDPHETSEIDFKMIYVAIADALDGQPLPEMNNMTKHIFKRCFTEIKDEAKSFLNVKTVQHCMVDMEQPREAFFALPVPTDDPEQVTLEYLTFQRAYNPFAIAVANMKAVKNVLNKTTNEKSVQSLLTAAALNNANK